ncbi:TatD family hydrolase (plasmid) [Ensifer adhaerens]|uniref:amidohydrolase family protein n=1 Tax=Ensifer adhaerens TaxID=106592 RepID=UPI0023A9218D|nr:amidohydrolase family protein [Ensifer adhaerens]WDZ79417.1 TatD family hydrolase [Ensifer adhaerens]
MIIDCHCHAGKGNGLTQPADTSAPLGRYLARAREANIDRTIIFAAFSDGYLLANREVARIIAGRPDRLLGFAFVHPVADKGRVEMMIREAVVSLGLVGIKVHRHDGRITREICEAARRYRLPVLYDVMGEVSVAEILAQEYPDVPFIIPHLGSFADDWKAQSGLIDHLVRHRNIFTDTAGVRRFDILEEAVKRAGASKILFGSDGPWLHPGVEIAKIEALGLNPEDRAAVLGGNVLRLVSRVQGFSVAA